MGGQITYSVKDSKGITSKYFVNLPTSFSIAQAIEAAQGMAELFDALIGGYIANIGLCYDVALPSGIKVVADANSDVEEGARFQWGVTGGFFSRFRLPTFLESLFHSGTTQVDLADADVDAMVDAMVSGYVVEAGGGATVTFTDSRDTDIIALDAAVESFGKDRG